MCPVDSSTDLMVKFSTTRWGNFVLLVGERERESGKEAFGTKWSCPAVSTLNTVCYARFAGFGANLVHTAGSPLRNNVVKKMI